MMQLHVSGRLVRDPTPKTSAGGKAYVHALMTASSGDGEVLITVMVFDTELGNLLASLRKGDSLSAIGAASIRAYTDKEGKPAAGVTLMANRLMAMTTKEAAPSPRVNGQRQQEAPPLSAYSDPELFRLRTRCRSDHGILLKHRNSREANHHGAHGGAPFLGVV